MKNEISRYIISYTLIAAQTLKCFFSPCSVVQASQGGVPSLLSWYEMESDFFPPAYLCMCSLMSEDEVTGVHRHNHPADIYMESGAKATEGRCEYCHLDVFR